MQAYLSINELFCVLCMTRHYFIGDNVEKNFLKAIYKKKKFYFLF